METKVFVRQTTSWFRDATFKIVSGLSEKVASGDKIRRYLSSRPTERMSMEPITPKQLFDLYRQLPDDDRAACLEMIAKTCVWEDVIRMSQNLSLIEQRGFSDTVLGEFIDGYMPILIHEAVAMVRETPTLLDDPHFKSKLNSRMKVMTEAHEAAISALEREKLKQSRDRKSDPEVVTRNVEICDLRSKDPAKWSLGRLAKKYDLPKSSIQAIIREAAKWLRLAKPYVK